MIRFNNSGLFNLPVGNVDFNKNNAIRVKDNFVLCVLFEDVSGGVYLSAGGSLCSTTCGYYLCVLFEDYIFI